MKKEIEILEGAEVNIEGLAVTMKSNNATIEKDFRSPLFSKYIKIEKDGNKVIVTSTSDKKKIKAMVGTISALIKAYTKGLVEGYTYKLKIAYVHFPFTVKIEDNRVVVNNFLGEKSQRKSKIIGDAKVDVKGDEITVTGYNLDHVSQTAANIETSTRLTKRDRRVFQDGCYIIQKKGE